MSPPRPPIPLPMAGGRPQPASAIRRQSGAYDGAPVGRLCGEDFPFTFGIAANGGGPPGPAPLFSPPGLLQPGFPLPPPPGLFQPGFPLAPAPGLLQPGFQIGHPTPGLLPSLLQPGFPLPPTPGLLQPGFPAGREYVGSPPNWPVRESGGLYGQTYIIGNGQRRYVATDRMKDWLMTVGEPSFGRDDDEVPRAGMNEPVQAGEKRCAPIDNEDAPNLGEPAAKRSRISSMVGRTVSLISRSGSKRVDQKDEVANVADNAAPTSTQARGPFDIFSRGGTSIPDKSVIAKPSQRTIRICVVGDRAAGKSALMNRITRNTFHFTAPSSIAELHAVNFRTPNDTIVRVETCTFQGITRNEWQAPLLPTFFHAAIICFSVDDTANVKAISEVWKPKLDASGHDGPVFVVGLKRDLRTDHPLLHLAFLPPRQQATPEMGRQAANSIGANGYAECSSKTGDNAHAMWESIVGYVVRDIEAHERKLLGGRGGGGGDAKVHKSERVKAAAKGVLAKCGLAWVRKDRK